MEETRKEYDWRRCDNLRWEAAGKSGRIRVCGEDVLLLGDTRTLLFDGRMVDEIETCHDIYRIGEFLPDGFRIVPRDPSVFRDWQVGDAATLRGVRYEVGLASGEIVVFFRREGGCGATAPMTSEEAFRGGFRLLPTEYEEELAAAENGDSADKPARRKRTRPSPDTGVSINERALLRYPDPSDPDVVVQATGGHLVNLSRTGYIDGADEQRGIDIERAWRLVAEDTRLEYEEFRQAMLAEFAG